MENAKPTHSFSIFNTSFFTHQHAPRGPTGTWIIGGTGPVGPSGPVPASGYTGETGPSSSIGATGATGPVGGTGAVGPQGSSTNKMAQVIQTSYIDTFTTSTTEWANTPVSAVITPSSASSNILILADVKFGAGMPTAYCQAQLLRNDTPIYIATANLSNRTATSFGTRGTRYNTALDSGFCCFLDSPSTTSATTYTVQIRSMANTKAVYINRTVTDTDTSAFPRSASSITVMEILP